MRAFSAACVCAFLGGPRVKQRRTGPAFIGTTTAAAVAAAAAAAAAAAVAAAAAAAAKVASLWLGGAASHLLSKQNKT